MSFWNRVKAFFGDPYGYRLAGKDLQGNKYFEATNYVNGKLKRKVEMNYNVSRYVQTPQYLREQYDPSRIPVQWDQWLRRTRKDAPTLNELQADIQRLNLLKQRVEVIENNDRLERERMIAKLKSENSDVGHFDAENERREVNNKEIGSRHTIDLGTLNLQAKKKQQHASLGGADFQPEEWKPVSVNRKTPNK